MAAIGAEWLLTGKGLGGTNHFESGGFIRSEAGVKHPDLQYHFLPMAVRYDGNSPVEGHGFQAHVGPMRSTSRGHVRIRTASHLDAPTILFNYMSTEQDRKEFRAAIRLTREVSAQKAFDRFRGEEISQGKKCRPTSRSTPTSVPTPKPPTTPAAPAAWALTTWRLLTARVAYTACKACAWWMRPSCRWWSAATSMCPPS